MAVRLSTGDVEELAGSEVVWTHQRSRGCELRVLALTAEARLALLESFGEAWLAQHLRESQERLDRWAETGVDGLLH